MGQGDPRTHAPGEGEGKKRKMEGDGLKKKTNSSSELREKTNLLDMIVKCKITQYNTI